MIRLCTLAASAVASLALAGCASQAIVAPVAPTFAPEAQFLIGRVADLRGDSAGAAASFLDAARADGGNPVIVTSALRAALEAGDFERALEAAAYAEGLGLIVPEGALTLAVDALRRKKYAVAEAYLADVHGSPLTRAARDGLLASSLAARGRTDAAIAQIDADPKSPLAGFDALQRALIFDRAGRDAEALAAYTQAHELGLRSAPARLLQARRLERMGRRTAALDLLKPTDGRQSALDHAELERIEAGRPPARLRSDVEAAAIGLTTLASLLIGQAPADLTTPYLTLALALDPRFDAARLAFVETQQGDETTRESSQAASLRALEAVPTESAYAPLALIQRAYILRDMGRSDDAIAAALAADATGDRGAAGTLADLYRSAQRFSEAEAIYDRLIKADAAPNWRLLFARGAMRERSGRWAEAESDLKAALALAPKQPEVMNYLAFAWVDRGERLSEALEMLREAVALSPESGHIVDSLGWAHYRRGEYDLALIHLERAVELEPDNSEVNEHLGDLYWRLNRKREAGFQWARALTLKPDAASIARLDEKVRIGLPALPKPAPLARAQ